MAEALFPLTNLSTALALRQAIWHKEEPHWHVCGIPSVFYTDGETNDSAKSRAMEKHA